MKLRKDRGNFSNLVSESLRVPASLRYILLLPEFFYAITFNTSLSLSLYPRIALSFVRSNKILAQSMPRTSYKRYFRKVNRGIECYTADIPIRVNTSFLARIHKRQVASDTFGDGALERTTRVSYRADDKSIS